MEIKTKFSINDEVWFISKENKVLSSKIIKIRVSINSKELKKIGKKKDLINTGNHVLSEQLENYTLSAKYSSSMNDSFGFNWTSNYDFGSHEIFATKKELLESL